MSNPVAEDPMAYLQAAPEGDDEHFAGDPHSAEPLPDDAHTPPNPDDPVDVDARESDTGQKARSRYRMIFLGLVGLVVIAVAGVAFTVYRNVMAKRHAEAMNAQVGQVEELVQDPPAADASAAAVGQAGAVDPMEQLVAGPAGQASAAAAASSALPTIGSSAPMASDAGTSPSSPTASSAGASDVGLTGRMASVERRVDVLEGKIDGVSAKLDTLSTSSASRPAARPKNASSRRINGAHNRQQTHTKKKAHTSSSEDGALVATSGKGAPGRGAAAEINAEPKADTDGALTLRGVYPPSGAYQRAWILDGARVVTVKVGDSVRGVLVESIDSTGVKLSNGSMVTWAKH